MGRVGIAVQQADGDTVHRLLVQTFEHRIERGLVERAVHSTVRVHPLSKREAPTPRYDHVRLVEKDVVLVVATLVGYLEDVAKPRW